jgi:hypothetical protein
MRLESPTFVADDSADCLKEGLNLRLCRGSEEYSRIRLVGKLSNMIQFERERFVRSSIESGAKVTGSIVDGRWVNEREEQSDVA